MQPCLVQESPKVYSPRGYGIPLSTECIERSLPKLHGHYTESRPLFDGKQSAGPMYLHIQRRLSNVYGHIENTQKYSEVSSISQNGILCFPKGPT